MKNLRFPLIFIAVAAVTLGQPKEINEDFAVQFATGVAKKFLDAVDRKRPKTAETYSYIEKRELPSGGSRRVPLVGEEVVAVAIQAREKFGKLQSRQLVETKILHDHHGMPDGKFVQFRYELNFDKKDKLYEILKIKVEGEQKGKVMFFIGR